MTSSLKPGTSVLLFSFHNSSYLIICRPGNFLCWLLKEQSEICQWSARLHHPQPIKHKYCSLCTYHIPLHPDSIQSITAARQILISVFTHTVNWIIPVSSEARLCCKSRQYSFNKTSISLKSFFWLLFIFIWLLNYSSQRPTTSTSSLNGAWRWSYMIKWTAHNQDLDPLLGPSVSDQMQISIWN